MPVIGPNAPGSEDGGRKDRPYRNWYTNAIGVRELLCDNIASKIEAANIAEAKVAAALSAVLATDTPLMDGVAAAGSSEEVARGDHRHPTDSSRASTDTATVTLNGLMSAADKAKLNGLFGIPIGGLLWFSSTIAPANCVAPSGDLLSRSAYADLWAHAQVSGMLVSDAVWLAANGPTGCFSSGDGSTTFRLPRLGGHFLRMWAAGQTTDSGRVAGSRQGDATYNITGMVQYLLGSQEPVGMTGAFSRTASVGASSLAAGGTGRTWTDLKFDASAAGVPTAAEIRPVNIAWPCFIRYK